ncbi:hypothetical protein KIL84_011983 [Mauremys mutica]|uniref:Uncharacterized protein n=1 Tax=Mauremys mutica TaxID=74926 RepID=A0A9D3XEM6_9SAUR|nr:hypothetical protein KIL84_011983 [Mauremys mutica]
MGIIYAVSQDLFETAQQSGQSEQSSMGEPDAGKGSLAALRLSPSTSTEYLSQEEKEEDLG